MEKNTSVYTNTCNFHFKEQTSACGTRFVFLISKTPLVPLFKGEDCLKTGSFSGDVPDFSELEFLQRMLMNEPFA